MRTFQEECVAIERQTDFLWAPFGIEHDDYIFPAFGSRGGDIDDEGYGGGIFRIQKA